VQDGFLHAIALRRGESPMSIFGHPEVYICAPLRLIFSLIFFLKIMLNYHVCIKTLSPGVCGNTYISSGNESHLRGLVNLKNSWQVTVYKARITKLILSAYLPLDGNFTASNKMSESWIPTRVYWNSLVIDLRCSNQLIYREQRPKYINDGSLGTMGSPKRRKPYGFGGLVRRLGSRCFSSNSDIIVNSCVGLKELIKINKENSNHINNKLIHIIADPEVLVLAYESIKSKPGNTTPGVDSTTLDKINLKWFTTTCNELYAGKFKFKPARRVYISKPGKKKKRPLTISSPRDKIVQQAVYFILNAIYEPSFLDVSHGSRPNRGNHTALKHIKFKYNGVKWCIEADIDSHFPSISHKILLRTLNKRITCSKFLALIKNSLKAGFVEDGKFHESNLGIFQGNITSPILNNIYLHDLDLFMLSLCESFNKEKYRRKNPVYRNILYKISKLDDTSKIKALRRDLWKVCSKDPLDPDFKRLLYTRYVDDFVVGVVGSRKDAVDIQKKIRNFLTTNLKLTLSEEKTLITQFSKNFIFFLGTYIKGSWEKEKRIMSVRKKGILRKVRITSRVVLHAPIKNLFEKATENGFFKKRLGKFVPTKVGRLINLDHADIVNYYNSMIRGNLNYYSFANNRKSLGSLVHGLKFSCARTLALKYKLRFASKAYRRFGGKLKCPKTGVELSIPSTFKAIKTFGCNELSPDEILFKKWNHKLTKSNLFKKCIICGSSEHIEMHHIRKVKDLEKKAAGGKLDFFTTQMAAINRKQIPLCSFHHKALHSNKMYLTDRQLLKNRIKTLIQEI
jgi:group II intron reverse transcriptase/maturase